MRQTFLVTRNGRELLRVDTDGPPARCRHWASGPGARDYERMLGSVAVPLRAGICSSDPRLLPVLTRTARLMFPSEEGFELTARQAPRSRRA